MFSIECDTTYPPDTLTKMLDTMSQVEDCAFVEGVQLGRHKTKYVGAWRADDIAKPTKIQSFLPATFNGVSPFILHAVDAGGLYCALIKADLYKQHHFEPFDKQGKNGLSCDVNFGLWLRRQGYSCLIDWSIQTDHIGEHGSVNLGNTQPVQVVFEHNGHEWTSRVV